MKLRTGVMKSSIAVATMAMLLLISAPIINAAANINLITSSSGPLAGGNVVYIEGDFATPDPVTSLYSTQYLIYAKTAGGTLWGYGADSNHNLPAGGAYTNGHKTPMKLTTLPYAVDEYRPGAYAYSSAAKLADGNWYVWGQNSQQNLGLGHDAGVSYYYPLQYPLDGLNLAAGETVVDMSTGQDAFYVITSAGRVLFAGEKSSCSTGNIADNNTGYTNDYTMMDITANIPFVGGEKPIRAFSGIHGAVITTDAEHTYALGGGDLNRFGLGAPGDYASDGVCPTEITANFGLGAGEYITEARSSNWGPYLYLTNLGNLYAAGYNNNSSTDNPFGLAQTLGSDSIAPPVKIGEDVVKMANGHTAFGYVTKSGELWVAGALNYGSTGTLGDGTTDAVPLWTMVNGNYGLHSSETIVDVAIAQYGMAVLTSEHRVLAFGDGNNSGSGTDTNAMVLAPQDITSAYNGTAALVSSVYFGSNVAISYEVVNEHLIRAVVPAGAQLGKVDVVVNGFGGAEITRKALGYEYVGSGGNGENVVCGGEGATPGVPNTGLSQFAQFMNQSVVKITLLAVAVISAALAGGIFVKIRSSRKNF